MKRTDQFTFFWKDPLSQWEISPFVVDGVRYVCAEQYMMARKAIMFGDTETQQKIMATDDPYEHQKLGRIVSNYDNKRWDAVARMIVYTGNVEKFRQNPDLKKLLFETYPTELVEASPVDRKWGIGLAEDNAQALAKTAWRGTNWLGEVLTKVRDDLMRWEKVK